MVFATHAFFVLMTAIKAFIYYYLVGIENYRPVIVLMTVAYLAAIYFICGSKKFAYCVISLLISVLMLTNVLYNRYFHMFFSFGMVSQAGKLNEVGGIALDLLKPSDLLLFIDPVLPAAFAFLMKKYRQHRKRSAGLTGLIPRILVLSAMAGSLVFISLNPTGSRLVTAISHQEIFSWHFRDSLFRSETDRENTAEIEKELALELELKMKMATETGSGSVSEPGSEKAAAEELSRKGRLHGIAEGRNLIVIQLEAFQNFLINAVYNGQEITPNLNRLIAGESIYFSGYYQQLGRGNTSDAEFVTNNSLYPVIYGPVYEIYHSNRFYGLPLVLKEKGYRTAVFHGYKKSFWNRDKAYPGQGFDIFIGEEDFVIDERIGFGLSDKSFFSQSTDFIKKLEQPFYSFIITLSSHVPYKLPASCQKLELLAEDRDTLFGDYIQAARYADEAVGEFIDSLKANGLYDNSMIVLYGDHFGIDCKNDAAERVKAFLGRDYTYNEMMNIPLIIHIPGSGVHETVDIVGGQVDFMPTVLNLMGISGNSLVMFGQDLLQAESGFVVSQTYLLKGSFIDDHKVFEMARTGIFEDSRAWDRKTGEPVSLDTCREGYERAVTEIAKSAYLLENDLLKDISPGSAPGPGVAGDSPAGIRQDSDNVFMQHDSIVDIATMDDAEDIIGALDSTYSKGSRLYLTELAEDGHGSLAMPDGRSFDKLPEWLAGHPDTFLIVPVSDANIDVLKLLNKLHPGICPQVIPLIQDFGDYVKAEYRGFRKIMLDLGVFSGIDEDSLAEFLDRNRISGALLSAKQVSDQQLLGLLESKKIAVFER
jgi:phosphoglycerol transferase MdoB-like AlkP superfamily enzyme